MQSGMRHASKLAVANAGDAKDICSNVSVVVTMHNVYPMVADRHWKRVSACVLR